MSSASDTNLRTLTSLVALVREFDHDAASHRRQISELLQYHPESFYGAAIEVLKRDADSRAAKFLVALLVSQGLLFRTLCDPGLGRDRAIALARMAVRLDPLVDIAMARQLADANSDGYDGIGMADRIMEILNQISDGKRILPSLMRMLGNNNPYLRSKALTMIGQGGRNLDWIKRRLEESDTRVRANAVEMLWGMDSPESRELLEVYSHDRHNRVAGNALLGLYLMGESSAISELLKMASHTTAGCRRTAAWVMGASGDPRFTEVLGRMIADSSGDVRKNAFAAVGRIRSSAARVAQTERWQVSAAAGPTDLVSGQRCISAAVAGADSRESPRIQPTQFILSEDSQPVWKYKVVERPESDSSPLTQYEIRYQPVCPEAAAVQLRIHTPSGWGEAVVRLNPG